jgi:hypothetical protein
LQIGNFLAPAPGSILLASALNLKAFQIGFLEIAGRNIPNIQIFM